VNDTATPICIDAGSLVGNVVMETQRRIARALSCALAEDTDAAMKSFQRVLVELFEAFDGFERAVAEDVVAELRCAGVDVGGLPVYLEYLEDDEPRNDLVEHRLARVEARAAELTKELGVAVDEGGSVTEMTEGLVTRLGAAKRPGPELELVPAGEDGDDG
jgi:hypothetical protein